MQDWDDEELTRYSRQIVLREVGGAGQAQLRASSVALLGMGGIGAPAALFLAAAGVGRLRLVDDDRVDLSNLHRQVLYRTADIGRPKVEAAAEALRAHAPRVAIEPVARHLDAGSIADVLAGMDYVLDGTDQFATRAMIADACELARVPLISASVQGFDGQLAVFTPWLGKGHPRFRTLFPDDPAPDALPSCAMAGVIGPLPGLMASLAATEIIKLALGIGDRDPGRLVCVDGLSSMLHIIRFDEDDASDRTSV